MLRALTQRLRLVDSTLREGEQHAEVRFTPAARREIARALDDFGVDVLELPSPAISPAAARELSELAGAGLRATVATHIRCHPEDAALAVEHGARAAHLYFATSEPLRRSSHGRDLAAILRQAEQVIGALRRAGLEVRFSCEDAFRTPLPVLLTVYRAVEGCGAHRVGVPDTLGIATPERVTEVVGAIRAAVATDIEFHGHDDAGCAVANAAAARRAGATHLDVTVLGLGERNGIAPLAALCARLWLDEPAALAGYRLAELPALDRLVAAHAGVAIPCTACVTSPGAFTHKAGVHAKAVLRDPHSYEALDPAVFGRARRILLGHRLVGRHALAARAGELGLALAEDELQQAAALVKELAERGPLSEEQVDALLFLLGGTTTPRTHHPSLPAHEPHHPSHDELLRVRRSADAPR